MGDHHQLIIVGAGGHASVVADATLAGSTHTILGVLDDQHTDLSDRLGHLGEIRLIASHPNARWILAIGDLANRREWLDRVGHHHEHHSMTISHPASIVSPGAKIGPGVFVGAGSIVQTGARVCAHAIINTGAIVEHDCVIGTNTHIAPGAILGGNVTVGNDTLIGLGARVKPGVTIGDHVTVGAGAVVIHDIPDGQTVVGVPARAMEQSVGNRA